MSVLLVGAKVVNGPQGKTVQTIFCLADHSWVFGSPPEARAWAVKHSRAFHQDEPQYVEIPKGVPYRPPRVDLGFAL